VPWRGAMGSRRSNCSVGAGKPGSHWRRPAGEEAGLFVPAVVAAPLPALAGRSGERKRARRAGGIPGIIELEIDGVTVRVGRGAEAKTVAAVIRALKVGT
jgi:hypothetical protein